MAIDSIQSLYRGYLVRKHFISEPLRKEAALRIEDVGRLALMPLASSGVHVVYLPEDLPVVLKKLGTKSAKNRFWANWNAAHLCKRFRYMHLVVPKCIKHKDFTIEEKFPVDKVTLKSQTELYMKNRSQFSEVAKEWISFLLGSELDDILTLDHPYKKGEPIPLARSDNLPLFLDKGKGKIALVDLGGYRLREQDPSKEEVYACVKSALALFPSHLEEICSVANVSVADFMELSQKTETLFQTICLGNVIEKLPAPSPEKIEGDFRLQMERGEILYYNFYKSRANQSMVVIHR
jgi:hypothetical protein